jgi:hypothetical protein
VREVAVTAVVAADIFTAIDRLRLRPGYTPKATPSASPPKSRRIKGEFLKGPIPLAWLSAAAKLRGKAPLAVALAVWFEAGRRRSKEVRLTTAVLNRFSVNRKAKYTALAAMEKAGLIRVRRQNRRNPMVTIIDLPGELEAEADGRDVTGRTPTDSQ